MGSFAKVADLPIQITGYELRPLSFKASEDFERLTTLTVMTGPCHHGGPDHEGIGEDVTYEAPDQLAHREAGAAHDLSGARSFGELCELIGSLDLFPQEPVREVSRLYRRWAYESAALDLALRQSHTSLAEVLEREARPLTFVASLGLSGTPGSNGEPSFEPIRKRLAGYPGLRFKLDPTPDWSDELIEQLAETDAIEIFDLKGQYSGTPVDVETDPGLYRRLAETFPAAILEDPDLSGEAGAVLEPHRARIAWDAPIHSVADIEALSFPPQVLNIKPSRLGGVRSLFEAYEHCDAQGIACYGGGQWELGPGRGQIQYLASLFHPDTPNDIAPSGYNDPAVPSGLPPSPLQPQLPKHGFRWE